MFVMFIFDKDNISRVSLCMGKYKYMQYIHVYIYIILYSVLICVWLLLFTVFDV